MGPSYSISTALPSCPYSLPSPPIYTLFPNKSTPSFGFINILMMIKDQACANCNSVLERKMSCTRVLNCHPHNLIHYSLGHKELSSKDSEPAQSAIRIATVQMMARNKCQLRWLPACPWNVCKRTLRSSLSLHSVPQGP